MGKIDLLMPKMGESIMEATILKWLKKEGDAIELDEPILEIATDKVDSDIPSPASGVLSKILFQENETVEIGKVIAHITTDSEEGVKSSPAVKEESEPVSDNNASNGATPVQVPEPQIKAPVKQPATSVSKQEYRPSQSTKFYSPLVRTIAQQERITSEELDGIEGSGANGRVTKSDILSYVENRSAAPPQTVEVSSTVQEEKTETKVIKEEKVTPQRNDFQSTTSHSLNGSTEIIEMDRMRKLIADHMINSINTSAHVTSFVEVDVTEIVNWRSKNKNRFLQQYGEKITYTPIFMEAVVRAIKDFPLINSSIDGDKIIKKNFVNLGMATALPSGNLIVPVIKNADHLNLLGLTKAVNDLAARARENNLSANEIQGGTFTLTNVGTFGNVMGTPIINQPQVAILAVGSIKKKPAVVETEKGDLIAIRHMMFLSLSYDHRIIDGYLGGSFLRRIADYLEAFDADRNI